MAKKVREGAPAYPLAASIPAGEFKARCLQIMDDVAATHAEVIITKYGRPVAKLVPVDQEVPDSFGALAGTVEYLEEDLVSPDHDLWESPGSGAGGEE
jgi:prevent-host-death family protein